MPSDAEFEPKYDVGAKEYDRGIQRKAFTADEDATRAELLDLVDLTREMPVLETGCGIGQDSWRTSNALATAVSSTPLTSPPGC
jgi:hypothetical protein